MAKRTETRRAREARLQREAAAVAVPERCDVAVVGGGAAGLVAAIVAAEAGASVVVLERDLSCGRPILATGNGRCNFANVKLDPRRFNDPDFVEATCGPRWLDDVLGFFRVCGLRWCLEDDRLYPASRQASSVRNVLLRRARKDGVTLAPARTVLDVEAGRTPRVSYRLDVGEDRQTAMLDAHSVIIATGGGATPIAAGLGLPLTPTHPVLCPLACEPSPLQALDGRRAHVRATLTKANAFFPSWQARGEVLFRSYGLSGIVVFDASRRAGTGDLIELDLAPDVSQSELQQLVDPFARGGFETGCLDGVLDPTIAALLEGLACERWQLSWPERTVPATDSATLIALVKALPFLVKGPAAQEQAQVTSGGLATRAFDPTTLACHRYPWLFACGETLDIDADCGGFNLAWAWKSGMVAGKAAAERART